jgi:kynureninase
MAHAVTPAGSAGAWQIGTPPVLGAAALYGALNLVEQAGLEAVRAKSLDLTAYLMFLVDAVLAPLGFAIGTPREAQRRGGHVAVEHPQAIRISQALRAHGVVSDFRPPDVIRLAPVALYTSYADVHRTVEALRDIVASGAYIRFEATLDSVT